MSGGVLSCHHFGYKSLIPINSGRCLDYFSARGMTLRRSNYSTELSSGQVFKWDFV